jgi:hypothetical protein
MSPMTVITSHRDTGIPILSNDNDEEFGEEIVALFIAHANSLRHAQGVSDLCVGELTSLGPPNIIPVEKPSSLEGGKV